MANFPTSQKLTYMSEGLMTDFDRSEDKEFRIAGNNPCEIYYVVSDDTGANTLQTGFNRVLGGWLYSVTEAALKPLVSIVPLSTDPTIASVSGMPASADTHLIVIYGDK